MSEEKQVQAGSGQDAAADAADSARAQQSAAGGEQGEQSHEELLLTLQDAQAKADEYWNQLLRVKADLENFQRRAERDLENAHKFALENFVRELLPVIDSLEMGLAAAREEGADLAKVVEGIDLTLKMLQGAVEKFGVQAVNPAGEKFDPERHQAMTTQPSEEVAPNTVLDVYQKGYLLNDRLIRPAMVVVSSSRGGKKQQGAQEGGEKSPTIDELA
ncbi:MAG: nucleotide exchange factor GrpE [Gammaproteobacteria bacterium]